MTDEADKAALLDSPLELGPGGFMFPTVETLAKLLCVANKIAVVDPNDGSPNWWMFNEFAKKMLNGLSTPTEVRRSEIPPELYDGMAVYVQLGVEKTEKIRPDMVSDVLDAVVRLIRKRERAEPQSRQEGK